MLLKRKNWEIRKSEKKSENQKIKIEKNVKKSKKNLKFFLLVSTRMITTSRTHDTDGQKRSIVKHDFGTARGLLKSRQRNISSTPSSPRLGGPWHRLQCNRRSRWPTRISSRVRRRPGRGPPLLSQETSSRRPLGNPRAPGSPRQGESIPCCPPRPAIGRGPRPPTSDDASAEQRIPRPVVSKSTMGLFVPEN